MKNKRITFLLGAGAARPWGGPTTNELTKSIRELEKFKTKNDHTFGEYLYNLLIEKYDYKGNINFETIISLLEYLFEYYNIKSIKGSSPKYHPFWPSIFNINEKIDNELFGHYNLHIAKEYSPGYDNEEFVKIIDTNNGNRIIDHIPCAKSRWKVKLIVDTYTRIIDLISGRIWSYDYESINSQNKYTNYLNQLISFLKERNHLSRFYTTNYDRLFPSILKNKQYLFDGFSENNDLDSEYYFDEIKILNDDKSICYYNLHGSIYWEEAPTRDLLKNTFIRKPISSSSSYFAPRKRVDNTKEVLFSNILVGFDKQQKVYIPPLNYFNYSFTKDCIESDIIVVIGSSLGDYDIRKSISAGLSDSKMKFVIIDKIEKSNTNNLESTIGEISPIYSRKYFQKNAKDHWFFNDEKSCYVYTNGFDGFLETEAWKDLDFLS